MNDLPIYVLVNKDNKLPKDYVPSNLYILDDNDNNFRGYKDPNLKPMLREDLKSYLDDMTRAAIYDGAHFMVGSGYRSYEYQKKILYSFLLRKGISALSICALPGTSEHQTGLAFDAASLVTGEYNANCEEDDIAIKWLQENSWKYGFILRYPLGKEKITGFNYEYWHYRFVGDDLSKYLYHHEMTLEEFYQIENSETPRILRKK